MYEGLGVVLTYLKFENFFKMSWKILWNSTCCNNVTVVDCLSVQF